MRYVRGILAAVALSTQVLAVQVSASLLVQALTATPAAALAIQTNTIVVTSGSWTDLGAGPIQVTTGGVAVSLLASDSLPTPDQAASALTYISTTPYVYQGTSHVYARVMNVDSASLLVTSTVGSAANSSAIQAPYNWTDPSTYVPWSVGPSTQVMVLQPAMSRFFLHIHNDSTDTIVSCSFGGTAVPGQTLDIKPGGDFEQEARAVWSGSVSCLSAGPKTANLYVGAS